MKKAVSILLLLLVGLAAGSIMILAILGIDSVSSFRTAQAAVNQKQNIQFFFNSDETTNSQLYELATAITTCIKERDYVGLSQYVHPEYGVVFSPYSNIVLQSDQYFTASQVARFAEDKTMYVWGIRDGSGEAIEMTPQEYFAEFVFDKDYTQAPIVGFNYIVRSGNTLENVTEIFSNADFIDLHYPGSDVSVDRTDWSTLRLVFEDYKGELRLSAIIHNEMTV